MRVLAALSGGVDSAVAAARCVDAGHDVTAVHLALAPKPSAGGATRGCCTLDDARDARRVADLLGVPFYVWDLAEQFTRDVVEDFVASYAAGRTPNPCIRCNERVKFAAVLDRARRTGFDAVCTGHYARLDGGRLHRGADPAKDQSYVLSGLTAVQLAGALLPLGDARKAEVRREAAERGLAVAAKPDSHDICFIPDGDTAGFLRRRLGEQPGAVVDSRTGEPVGSHAGAYGFTLGQRRGLALDRPAADGRARYVLAVEPARRAVVVGPADSLLVDRVHAERAVWSARRPEPGEPLEVQLSAHGAPIPAVCEPRPDGGVVAHLARPSRAAAPGQAMAVYAGTLVLGAATVALPASLRV